MIGTRIFIIRVASTVLIIIASFVIGWYVYTRFTQLNFEGLAVREDEINNPRLNYPLLEALREDLDSRRVYLRGEHVWVKIPEYDPFYE
ncbi:hypothetical protein JW766_00870 [Candidatus Dojkabacteria bacterium]|nr:hypothetical protein [Candidatus Dojkabacteria bacterium]